MTGTGEQCAFCRIVAGELPAEVVTSTGRSITIMDIRPATDGHLLVLDRLGADGVNLTQATGTAAWQEVFHLHLHVVPRYVGDPLVLPWQPERGDPERIALLAARLRSS